MPWGQQRIVRQERRRYLRKGIRQMYRKRFPHVGGESQAPSLERRHPSSAPSPAGLFFPGVAEGAALLHWVGRLTG